MNNPKITITVAIPAYNEELNIRQIVESVMAQRGDNFRLEKVHLISDKSSDRTQDIIQELSAKYPLIHAQHNDKRIGKINTMNQMIQQNASEVILFFDADIKLSNNFVLDNIAQTFVETGAELVGGRDKPFEPHGFFGTICYTWIEIWDEAKSDPRNTTDLHKLSARIMALRKNFADSFVIPESAVVDDQYVYLKAKEQNRKIHFSEKALVYYKLPTNLHDYLIQTSRYIRWNTSVVKQFSPEMTKCYAISQNAKSSALFHSFSKNPIFTLLSIGLQVIVRISKRWIIEEHESGTWIMITSTK